MKPRSLATSASRATQLTPAAVQPRHYGPDRRIHDLGDFLVRETFHIGVVDRHPELFRQCLQRCFDLGVRQRLQGLDLGRAQSGGGMLGVGRQLPVGDLLGRILRRLALLLAVAVDVGVGQDPVQPRLEVGALPERAEARRRPSPSSPAAGPRRRRDCASCAARRRTAGPAGESRRARNAPSAPHRSLQAAAGPLAIFQVVEVGHLDQHGPFCRGVAGRTPVRRAPDSFNRLVAVDTRLLLPI